MRQVHGNAQESVSHTLQTKREIHILPAACGEVCTESTDLIERITPHKKGKVLQEKAVLRLRRGVLQLRGRQPSLRLDLRGIQVLPLINGTVGEWSNSADLRTLREGIQQRTQPCGIEQNALAHEEEAAAGGKCTPIIVEQSKAIGLNRTDLNVVDMPQCLLCPLKIRSRRHDKQFCLRAAVHAGRARRLCRLAQVVCLLRDREDDAEALHRFSSRSSMKSAIRIFAATCSALSRSPISCRRSAMLRSVASQPGSRRSAAMRSAFAPL